MVVRWPLATCHFPRQMTWQCPNPIPTAELIGTPGFPPCLRLGSSYGFGPKVGSVCVCANVRVHVCVCSCVCIRVCVCEPTRMSVCMHVHARVYMCVTVCERTCLCVHTCVHVCACADACDIAIGKAGVSSVLQVCSYHQLDCLCGPPLFCFRPPHLCLDSSHLGAKKSHTRPS